MREFELLRHVFASNARLPVRVTLPPGDDMGQVRLDGRDVLVTVDQVADGVHVDRRTTSLRKIGRKAVTRNLSDIAAMAARPVGGVVAASLPRDMNQAQARELLDAMRDTAMEYDCPIFGGDVSMWDHPLLISVTLLAEPAGIEPVHRTGARVGDFICVTGHLGGSLQNVTRHGHPYTHHLDFEPRLNFARQISRNTSTRPRCMIDLSDGLARDLGHLGAAAGLGAELWADALPISEGCKAAASQSGRPLWQHALGDGEDYELLFAVSPTQKESLPREIDGVPISVVGIFTAATPAKPGSAGPIMLRKPDGSIEHLNDIGWEHRTA